MKGSCHKLRFTACLFLIIFDNISLTQINIVGGHIEDIKHKNGNPDVIIQGNIT